MKLFEIYKEVTAYDMFAELSNILTSEQVISENGFGGLSELLIESDKIIFDKFKINKTDKVYFITGSASLYLMPDLIKYLNEKEPENFPLNIGDLDIVIYDNRYWSNINDYLSENNINYDKNLLSNGIYRPYLTEPKETELNIEAFNVWNPSKAPGYSNIKVRNQKQIISDLNFKEGYYFMGLKDILDYKLVMNRPKEQALNNLIKQHSKGGYKNNRDSFLKKVAEILTSKFS